jgi:hypothetical protein
MNLEFFGEEVKKSRPMTDAEKAALMYELGMASYRPDEGGKNETLDGLKGPLDDSENNRDVLGDGPDGTSPA